MWPATTWDDRDWGGTAARGWSVLGRVRAKQKRLRKKHNDAQRRQVARARAAGATAAKGSPAVNRDPELLAWTGCSTVIALLFAQPDEPTIQMVSRRLEYFDIRTGETWDLFFPGYYKSEDSRLERGVGSQRTRLGRADGGWWFSPRDFDWLRQEVEEKSDGRWQYSGGSDLVLINAYLPLRGEPTVDWTSTIAGSIHPPETIAGVIERITRDLQLADEDAAYGVSSVVRQPTGAGGSGLDAASRDFTIQALAGIAASLGLKAMGL